MSQQSTELGGMWQETHPFNDERVLRVRVKVGHHLGRLNAQARLTRLAVEQSWQHRAEELEREARARRGEPLRMRRNSWQVLTRRGLVVEQARAIRARLAASQRARKVGGLAF